MDSTKKILLVEDDADHVELIRSAISKVSSHYQIDVVNDGVEAIDYLFGLGQYAERQRSPMPDLILLDLNMPRMDGRQLLKVLRSVRHSDKVSLPPIVVLTSSDRDADIDDAYRLGAHSYLVKSVEFESFTRTVRTAITYWLEFNEPRNRDESQAHLLPVR
jgi:two-component system response regulator